MRLALRGGGLVLATLLLRRVCLQIGHRVVRVDRWWRHLDALTSRLSGIIISLTLLLGLTRCNLDFGRATTGHLRRALGGLGHRWLLLNQDLLRQESFDGRMSTALLDFDQLSELAGAVEDLRGA